MKKKIIILHEYGAPTHYNALNYLAELNGYQLEYFTFDSVLSTNPIVWLKAFIKHPLQHLRNAFFLSTLTFRRPSKIVIGIAPFNNHLPLLIRLTKKHQVYYHTSYCFWDGSICVHEPYSDSIIECWKNFTRNYVKHIYCVSQYSKEQIVANGYATPERISVVNHSYLKKIDVEVSKRKKLRFICVAVLAPHKGILQLLEYFSKHPELNLTLVGDGVLKENVIDYSHKYKNIQYLGYIKGSQNLFPIYQDNSFLILNCQKTSRGKELFGMAIIEGMACGCVPIAISHPGPREIISEDINGVLCDEGEIERGIEKAISMTDDDYLIMRKNAIETGQQYHCSVIASRWKTILE